MTPKEKALQLIYIYNNFLHHIDAKKCAIITVDETLNANLYDSDEKEYWQQVKQEIEKL